MRHDKLFTKLQEAYKYILKEEFKESGRTHMPVGRNPNDKYNWALVEACEDGNLELIQKLLDHDMVDIDFNGGLPLINAAENGHIEVVKYLIDKASPDALKGVGEAAKNAQINGFKEVHELIINTYKNMTNRT